MALGPTHEEIDHRPGVAADFQLPADADHAVPDPDQVPQRRAAAVRRAAHQRIPHEGRLQLRRLAGRAQRELRAHVRRLLPHLRALRAGLPGRRGRERADRRRRQPRVHGPGRQRRRHRAALQGLRLRGQPGEGRDRRAGSRAAQRAHAAAANGADAGRGTIEQVSEVPQVPAAADDQDADLRWPTASRSPSWSAAITRPTRARFAARPGPPRSNWPTPR